MERKSSFKLSYGGKSVSLILPGKIITQVFQPREKPPLKDISRAVRTSLDEPIGSKPLGELLSPGDRITILTADITRKVNYPVWLPHFLDECNRMGVKDSEITLLVGIGIHSPHDDEKNEKVFGPEICQRVGTEICKRVNIVNHDSQDRPRLIDLGATTRGTPIRLNSIATHADHVIVTGAAGYHCFAGFSGGRKGVLPGISSKETIQNNHRLALKKDGRGREMLADYGRLKTNPVHEDMVEVARKLAPDFLINVVTNSKGEVVRIFSGELVQAHEKACALVEEMYRQDIEQKADLIIASSGGFPHDLSFYQAVKTLESTTRVLRDGGTLIMIAECKEGYGSTEWEEFLRHQEPDAIEDLIRKDFTVGGFIYYDMKMTLKRIHVVLVSSFPSERVTKMGIHPAPDLSAALEMAKGFTNPLKTAYIFPQGSMTVPFIGPSS